MVNVFFILCLFVILIVSHFGFERGAVVLITKTCPCNMQKFLKVEKMINFR